MEKFFKQFLEKFSEIFLKRILEEFLAELLNEFLMKKFLEKSLLIGNPKIVSGVFLTGITGKFFGVYSEKNFGILLRKLREKF